MATKDVTDDMVLKAVEQSRSNGFKPLPYEILSRQTGECEKVCFRAMERAAKRGLIEYGVSLRTAWVVENV